jgi:hypothetical protein
MKFEIKHRWTGAILFEIETSSWRLAVEAAIKANADLTDADLTDADLTRANLTRANLTNANLTCANLRYADLRYADLTAIKNDVWRVLLHAIPEVPGLRNALVEGRVNGSAYEGDCACLCGTIANVRGCRYDAIEGVKPDASSAAERFFMAIKKGDTPERNPASKIAVEWIDEFAKLIQSANVGAENSKPQA